LRSLKCFDRIVVGDLKVKGRGFTAVYTLEFDGAKKSYPLMQRYEEDINVKGLEEVARLASIVPAVNYTLFADEIRFEFPLHEHDLEFFETVADATARDIFVNRIVNRTGLIRDEYVPNPEEVEPEDAKPRAHVSVPETFTGTSIEHEGDPASSIVMSSGGQDSLLSYGLLAELGLRTYPCYLNEAGRHWLVALNAYRWFARNVPETKRVWSNVDRLFTFIERNMKIVVPDFQRKSKEVYPARLFWFEHYAFSFLPLAIKHGVGNIVFGNEFDDFTGYQLEFRGIRHYCAAYDQSQEFEKYMTRWFAERGFQLKQWSPIRPITKLVVARVLSRRYPHLFKLAMSCHSPIYRGGRLVPCGRCFKCTGVILFLLASGVDPAVIGYDRRSYADLPRRILEHRYRIGEAELEHSAYLANRIWGLKLPRANPHPRIEMMLFDELSSHPDAIPYCEVREKIFDILEKYTTGYARFNGREWVPTTREEVLKLGGCA
jgi:7-cyano-7-deazaguanine synthase in queuosine biosynthesis